MRDCTMLVENLGCFFRLLLFIKIFPDNVSGYSASEWFDRRHG
jgi:hypothetical protein